MIKVLIVDDDKFSRKGLVLTIPWEKYGMVVVGEAANGKKALELMENTEVNLAFVDIAMPIMDGLEMIQHAKERFPNTKFVVLSFNEEFKCVQNALRLGVIDYLSKEDMDTEEYDEMMTRIKRKFVEESRNDEGVSYQIGELESLFQSVLWLYDNMRLKEIETMLQGGGVNMRSFERLLSAVISRVMIDTETELRPVPMFHSSKEVMEYLHQTREMFRIQVLNNPKSMHYALLQAANYVWQNSSQHMTAEDVAEKIAISRSYFSISIKKLIGITFGDFLRRERVFKACCLIERGMSNQEEIAEKVGYGDVRNFKNAFLEVVGCRPSEYIKKMHHTQ